MPKGIKNTFWEDEENAKLFVELCTKSESRPLIKWAKFRRLDKDNKFADLTGAQLCTTYRKMWLKKKGICPKCGKYYLEEDQNVCSVCVEKNKKYIADFFERKKNAK